MLKRMDEMKQKTDTVKTFEVYNRAINELPPIKQKKAKRKGKSVLPLFATFLAGAVVVGALSFAADYYNVFSSNKVADASIETVSSQVNAVQATQSNKQSTATTYELASQAVVKVENYSEPSTNSIFNDPRLWMFFSEEQQVKPDSEPDNSLQNEANSEQQPDLSQYQLAGSGTGYIFEADGYILTNEHVIHGADYVAVTVPGYDQPYIAEVTSASTELDIAVLKIEPRADEAFTAIPLGDSEQLAIGEWVMAIGNPYGYDYTLTMGIISAKERPITIQNSEGQAQQFEHMLQTDASINPGNSGGPLLNELGEVIGMNTAVNSEAQGMGFAIPINVIKQYLSTITL